jgi:hypothetical protein
MRIQRTESISHARTLHKAQAYSVFARLQIPDPHVPSYANGNISGVWALQHWITRDPLTAEKGKVDFRYNFSLGCFPPKPE